MITSNSTLRKRFTEVFEKKLWDDNESVSGPGSNRNSKFVEVSLEALQYTVGHYTIHTMSDIPCGDMNWMPLFLDENTQLDYTGYDIVDALIEQNARNYPKYKFRQMDVTKEIPPKADLIFCKELLLHLRYEDICNALNSMKRSGSMYLLLFNSFGAANILELPDLQPGTARMIDVCAAPFRYPAPIWRNQYCGLWELEKVPELAVSDEPILPDEQTSAERELRDVLDNQIGMTKRLQAALEDQVGCVTRLYAALDERAATESVLRAELAQKETLLNGLLNSRSWKLTKPLRALTQAFRRD